MAGEMTPQEFNEMQYLVNTKIAAAGDCPTCGKSGAVQIAGHLVTPIATTLGGSIQLQAANYPQVMLLCTNCGFTRYFNAIILRGQSGG